VSQEEVLNTEISDSEFVQLINEMKTQKVVPPPGAKEKEQPEDWKIRKVSKLLNSPYPKLKCWLNAEEHVAKNGGRAVFGWAVFRHTKESDETDYIQAQHHAIWTDDKDHYLDVTPEEIDLSEIYFIADSRAQFDSSERFITPSFWFNFKTGEYVWTDGGKFNKLVFEHIDLMLNALN
jgi:hypothetical protein